MHAPSTDLSSMFMYNNGEYDYMNVVIGSDIIQWAETGYLTSFIIKYHIIFIAHIYSLIKFITPDMLMIIMIMIKMRTYTITM